MHIKLIVKIVVAKSDFSGKLNFMRYVSQAFFLKIGWSLIGSNLLTAVANSLAAVVCTKTLYITVDQGLLGKFYNYDLPESLNAILAFIVFAKIRNNLGRSIEDVLKNQ